MPQKKITISLQDNEIEISYPKSGEFIDIATLKTKMTGGNYSRLQIQNSHDSGLATKLVDAYSFFSITIPDIKKILNLASLYDLEVLDSLELIDVYENIVIPWLAEWSDALNARIAELDEKYLKSKQAVV
jgi:hypothetical protein